MPRRQAEEPLNKSHSSLEFQSCQIPYRHKSAPISIAWHTKYYMINKAEADKFTRLDQPFSYLNVLLARFGIAGRMVVSNNNCKCAVSDRLAEHLPWMNRRLADRALRNVQRFAERMEI